MRHLLPAARSPAIAVPTMRGAFLLSMASFVAAPAYAQEAGERAATIVVNGVRSDDATVDSGGLVIPVTQAGPLGPLLAKDLPFSTTSIPQAIIQDQQAHTPDEALKNDPSVRSFPTQLGFAQNYLIRGFSVGPVYGFFQDGLDVLGYTTPALETDDRIDILKGAASVLYGFADPGGVVNFITKKPLDQPLTDVTLGYLSSGTINGEVDASRRFGPDGQFGARVDLYDQYGDMALRRSKTERNSQLASFDWRPTDGVKLWASAQRFETKRDGGNNVLFLAPIKTKYVIDTPDPRDSYGQDFYFQNTEGRIFSGGLDATLGAWTISAAAGHSNDDLRSLTTRSQPPVASRLKPNGDYAVIPAGSGFDDNSDAARASVTRTDEFGAVKNNLTVAFSYGEHRIRSYGNAAADKQLGITNIYNPVLFNAPTIAIAATTDQRVRLSTIIATDRLEIGPVTLMGGGVRSNYSARVSSVATGAVTSYQQQDRITPLAAILFHPLPAVTAYVSYIEALTPGGTAPSTAVNANEVLSPFKSKQYEVGLKTEPAKGLAINAALFRIEEQLSFLNDANVFTADGQQRNQGVEVTVAGKITPRLSVFGGASYLEPKVSNSRSILTGRGIGVAKRRASLFVAWDVAAVPGLALQGGAYYVSRYKQQENLPAAIAQGFAQEVYVRSNVTFDAGPRYSTNALGTPLTFRLYGTNLFNKGYWLNPNNNNGLVPGAPRTIRFNATASF